MDWVTSEMAGEFVTETRDAVAEVEPLLLDMEDGSADPETIGAIFRAFHTVKGTAAFLEFDEIVRATHAAESLLAGARAGELALTPGRVALLIECVDFMHASLVAVEADASDAVMADESARLVGVLTAAMTTDPGAAAPAPAPTVPPADDGLLVVGGGAVPADAVEDLLVVGGNASGEDAVVDLDAPDDGLLVVGGHASGEDAVVDLDAADDGLLVVGGGAAPADAVEDLLVVGGNASGEDAVEDLLVVGGNASGEDAVVDMAEPDEGLLVVGGATEAATPAPADAPAPARKPNRSEPQQTSIRVDLGKLDQLMNLVGELIIAENMVTRNEDLEGLELENFQRSASHLNQITRGLQDLAMSVRMVPLRSTFRKMLRVVRDVARKRGKPADLELIGEDTEVDRTVIEAIGDPLVHLIRNAVDHGLEDAAGRAAAGKPAKGQLRLEARHEAGEVWVELHDDGKGLDRARILARGIERGLVDPGAELEDAEVWDLIFQPGFSTAEAVTDVSGRGVGMDVVRRNIADLQGRIDVESRPGRGTTFTLCIPLTLAIIDGMLARIGDRIYTVPLFNVREIIRPEKGELRHLPAGGEVVLVRGKPLPILSLRDKHGIEGAPPEGRPPVLLVVENGGVAVALPVDSLLGQQQTVIKPLPDYLSSMPGIAGCSLMSNGTISLILDVKGLVQEVRSGADRRRRSASSSSTGGRTADAARAGGPSPSS